ncbi:MAG: CPBP family intramembrane glutamic endopeptidase [Bacteroidota bacterium]
MQKNRIQRYQQLHPLLKVCIYLGGNYGLIFLAQFVGPLGELAVNIFLCIAVIAFTWFILKLEGRKLDEIGWRPINSGHWGQLIIGTIVGMVMLICVAFNLKWQTGFRWESTTLPPQSIITLLITVFASAYVQELAFRGYPFQLLLKKYGVWPAQLIIALFFGLMHVSSNMSLGDMASVMFTTGLGSLLFALAYLKTKNLALPTGIHFGWNYLQVLLPRHPSQNGKGIVKIVEGSFDGSKLNVWTWIMPYAIILLIVAIGLWFFNSSVNKTEHKAML